jgi:DNA modification methylase
MKVEHFPGNVTLWPDDCMEVLAVLPECSIDSCVTDPPYHLTNNTGSRSPLPGQYTPIGKPKEPRGGFMGKQWDGGDIAFRPETWAAVFRVLKPGAHLIAFSGTRTYHRMVCAIEDAGFEVRDQIGWAFGSGFPKSHDISKAIDRAAGYARGTAPDFRNGPNTNNATKGDKYSLGYGGQIEIDGGPATDAAREWEGWGTALKPAWEPIVVARKPLSEPTIAANVLKWGTGALNIDGCRVGTEAKLTGSGAPPLQFNGTNHRPFHDNAEPRGFNQSPLGRWPANLIHDGSEEVVGAFPDVHGAGSARAGKFGGEYDATSYDMGGAREMGRFGDEGSAARFFYSAKADSDDRLGSKHPTVKPVDLIQYLVRLVTPKGGTVLDPFAGTGTLGEACIREGMKATLIEREEEYQEDIRRRMKLAMAGPDERARESAKAKNPAPDLGPLFQEAMKL